MSSADDIERRIAELQSELRGIPFLAHRGDFFGREPRETEAQHWLGRLEAWPLLKSYAPDTWEKMLRGD